MKNDNKDQAESITVKLFIHGDGTKEDRQEAAEKMLDRAHPVVVGKEVFFLDRFELND